MSIAGRVGLVTGSPVVASTGLAGGDISRAFRMDLADGRTVFAKQAPAGGAMTAVEAAGLSWLADGGARVPELIGVDDDLLVSAWVEPHRPDRASARRFGQSLARLHRSGAPAFGSAPPGVTGAGWIGAAPMSYADCDDWPTFFVEHRIRPYAAAARAAGSLTAAQHDVVSACCEAIPALAGPQVAPARLHGDLWSGNVLLTGGTGLLIDPAAHGGHPESDLAMLALFPPPNLPEITAGYESVAPLPDGWRGRTGLHQLYPLLVHAVLFGGAYGAAAAAAAAKALRNRV